MMQRTQTRTDHAARVSRKVQGDVESLVRLYGVSSATSAADLAHDLKVGLEYGCIERADLFLYDTRGVLREVVRYGVTDAAGLDASTHSGRFDWVEALVGGSYRVEINLRDRPGWEQLKSAGLLAIAWAPCAGTSTLGMTSSASGAYVSGNVALSRSILRSA